MKKHLKNGICFANYLLAAFQNVLLDIIRKLQLKEIE